ncbi:alpha/beta hydrolase [Criblamydia sequanensis]|uniref:Phospholipase/Carboxylesterase n=1 Tax=Candidatus Criblamydia sequanensis CRIB-18 TaxID=1437425 RepID=A0A090D019_9BACT|nr:dienelactone hydrolase family protein [Criblamydia sequanensis]CDR34797.1 Phospholipase/Carboxylesterase [Criblamydia sequanensis CRIB-18]
MSFTLYHQGSLKTDSQVLILLHGRGAKAESMFSLGERLGNEKSYLAAINAPNNTWYPQSFMVEESLNQPFLRNSIEYVAKVIEDLAKIVSYERIYIIGFSQGACLALEVAARHAKKYGGVVAFSGGLIGNPSSEKYKGNFEKTKIFIGNSDRDPFIPLNRSEESKIILESMGAAVTLNVYEGMAHTINEDEIRWVKKNILLTS